jgi:GxxExxY protein
MALSYPETNEITSLIIGAAIEVHRHLGPGLLESAYEEPLHWELSDGGLTVERERSIPLIYKGRLIKSAYRADMIVNRSVLLEIKSIEKTLPIHKSQVLTYRGLRRVMVWFQQLDGFG